MNRDNFLWIDSQFAVYCATFSAQTGIVFLKLDL